MKAGRALAGALAALAVVLLNPAVAGAAGTGGVELTPLSGAGPSSAFHVRVGGRSPGRLSFVLRNLGGDTTTSRLYAAAVSRTGTAFAVAGPGSAAWIRLPEQTVVLAPGEVRRFDVTVDGVMPSGREVLGAIVQEPVEQSALVRRVATMVYVQPGAEGPAVAGRSVAARSVAGRPVALLVVATVLLAFAGALVGRRIRWPSAD